jgi:hypothetical protein
MQRVVREAVLAAAADAIATEEVLGSPTRRLGDSRARFDVDRAMVADATAHLVWKDCVARFYLNCVHCIANPTRKKSGPKFQKSTIKLHCTVVLDCTTSAIGLECSRNVTAVHYCS